VKKTVMLGVKATPQEAEVVKADAAEHGMKVSPYLLSLALGKRRPPARRSLVMQEAEDLKRLGQCLSLARRVEQTDSVVALQLWIEGLIGGLRRE